MGELAVMHAPILYIIIGDHSPNEMWSILTKQSGRVTIS